MFENLSDRLGGVFDRLTKQGALSEDDVTAAMREVRVALLEADVSLAVARNFVKAVTAKATGAAVTKSVSPGQQVVKIVHDELIRVLQGDDAPEALRIDNPPAAILMVGLQGSGKTTTTAKLALRLKDREKKRVLMASLDTNRPAAMEQLAILGQQIGVDTLPIVMGQTAVQIAQRAKTQASLGGYDVVMLDTAGRLHIDEALMTQVQQVRDIANPRETLLVVDGLTGQDAVNVATDEPGNAGAWIVVVLCTVVSFVLALCVPTRSADASPPSSGAPVNSVSGSTVGVLVQVGFVRRPSSWRTIALGWSPWTEISISVPG